MKTQFEQNEPDRMRNETGNYKWGIFYYNPRDSRCFVPKRNQWMGWTLNFANPYSWLTLLGIVLFAIVMARVL
jgi:uncharacterized membrane protein